MSEFTGFSKKLFTFLDELEQHNHREWFLDNKDRYEEEVREPALAFIRALQPWAKKKWPAFVASDKKQGGSMMRVNRDIRFSKDKRPYKTNVGIQLRHLAGKDVHAPGLYIHLANDGCFIGAGMYMPPPDALGQVREHIVKQAKKYEAIVGDKAFAKTYKLAGESLARPPRGFDKDHPLIEELKRKSFIAVCDVTKKEVLAKDFATKVAERFDVARPFCAFLCEATKAPF